MRHVLIVAMFVAAGSRGQAQELSTSRPQGTPDFNSWSLAEIDQYEHGQSIRLKNVSLSYRLYVDPNSGRQGLYEFSRFRSCSLSQRNVCEPETLVWLRYDSERREFHPLVFLRLKHLTWRRLWLVSEYYWQPVSEPANRDLELQYFRNLLAISSRLRSGTDPRLLSF